jgi:hypothetical protein
VHRFRRDFHDASTTRPIKSVTSYAKGVASNAPLHLEVRGQIPEGKPDWNRPGRTGFDSYELEVRRGELVLRDRFGEQVLLTGPLEPNTEWRGNSPREVCTILAVEVKQLFTVPRRTVEVMCDDEHAPASDYSPRLVRRRVLVLAEGLGIIEQRDYFTAGTFSNNDFILSNSQSLMEVYD